MEPELPNDTVVMREKKAICHPKVTLRVTFCFCLRQQTHIESGISLINMQKEDLQVWGKGQRHEEHQSDHQGRASGTEKAEETSPPPESTSGPLIFPDERCKELTGNARDCGTGYVLKTTFYVH